MYPALAGSVGPPLYEFLSFLAPPTVTHGFDREYRLRNMLQKIRVQELVEEEIQQEFGNKKKVMNVMIKCLFTAEV